MLSWLNGKKTAIAVVLSLAVAALARYGIVVPAELVTAIDVLLGLGIVHKTVKALPHKAPAAVPLFVGLALALGACAAPTASQGTAGQGGSTGSAPVVCIYIGSDNGAVTVTSAPTAAPSAASDASSSQTATNDIKPDVTIPAGGLPTLGANLGAAKASAAELDAKLAAVEKALAEAKKKLNEAPAPAPIPAPAPPENP